MDVKELRHLQSTARQLAIGDGQLMTTKEVAEMLSCTPRHVQDLMANKAFPTVKLSSRCVRIPRAAVLKYIAEHTYNAVT